MQNFRNAFKESRHTHVEMEPKPNLDAENSKREAPNLVLRILTVI